MTRSPNPRRLAVDLLGRIDEGAYANLVVPPSLQRSGLARRDRDLVTELVYGTTRMRRACDWLVDRFLGRPVEPAVRNALRVGAYQLHFLKTAPHAAVSETVAVVPERARGLVNAVLRKVAADPSPPWPDVATELSYPDWIVVRLTADLGEDAALGCLQKMNQPASVTRREDGYVQDLASQWVVAAVECQAGDRVADLCSAPGGKATGLARTAALVIATDIQPSRVNLVAANAGRLGTTNVVPVVADGRTSPLRAASLDRVLVDAPCSGLGVLRRRADARWRISPADVDDLAVLQRELLVGASSLLRAGGTLVYSVCTMTRAETLEIDAWAERDLPDFSALGRPGEPWEPLGRGALLLPQAAGTDGMYLLRLRAP